MAAVEAGMPLLSGAQVKELTRRLTSGLTDIDFQTLTYAATGDQVYKHYTSNQLPLYKQIFETIECLEADRTTDRFLAWVYAEKKHNTSLRQYILSLAPKADRLLTGGGLHVQRGGEALRDAPDNPFAPGLQTYVRPRGMVDLGLWIRRLLAIERQVCVIEHGGEARGTGFLVGPHVVLTNWHVIEAAPGSADPAAGSFTCRFDYNMLSDRSVPAGVEVVAEAIVASSPYAPAERTATPDAPPPKADQLDYCLLRLPEGFAAQARGSVSLPTEKPELGDDAPILIVQHPKGGPMKLAMDLDSVMGPDPSGFRLRYRTSTDEGSSGSPCFAMDWSLLALHHFGDTGFRTPYPTYNQGIPAHLVRTHICTTSPGAILLGA